MLDAGRTREVLPPSGAIVLQNLFPEVNWKSRPYTFEDLQEASTRDHAYANNTLRSRVHVDLLGLDRTYGPSKKIKTEFESIEALRELSNGRISYYSKPYKGRRLSNEAKHVITQGLFPGDKRFLEMSQLVYYDEFNGEDKIVWASKRRKASLESKVAKTLERFSRYRTSKIGEKDKELDNFYGGLSLLEELNWDLLNWKVQPNLPFEICDACTCDFSANTLIVNSRFRDNGNTSREKVQERLNTVINSLLQGNNKKVVAQKDNIISQKRD